MAILGKMNPLRVVKMVEFGLYLDGGSDGEILLPRKEIPENCEVGDTLMVFIYKDSEDRMIATTQTPYALAGDFTTLEVVAVNEVGAFLDWGLLKNLMVPFREQKIKMQVGWRYPVFVYVDFESQRIAASAKIEKFVDESKPDLEVGDQVDLLIYKKTDLGWKAVINQQYTGMIYDNEVFQLVETGMKMKGYIRSIRPDDKIDLVLDKPGFEKIDDFSLELHQLKRQRRFFTFYGQKSCRRHLQSIWHQ